MLKNILIGAAAVGVAYYTISKLTGNKKTDAAKTPVAKESANLSVPATKTEHKPVKPQLKLVKNSQPKPKVTTGPTGVKVVNMRDCTMEEFETMLKEAAGVSSN